MSFKNIFLSASLCCVELGLILSAECFTESNIDYAGYDIIKNAISVPNATDCCDECFANAECTFWSWKVSNQNCWLKDSDAGSEYQGGATSGYSITASPTGAPTEIPTESPTGSPTESPTESHTENPTQSPTEYPTENPTQSPTEYPTESPTETPTAIPTANPTINPTTDPTANPTINPTTNPTTDPTANPTANPTENPTDNPTANPTENPTESPSETPTEGPTSNPTESPTEATVEEETEEESEQSDMEKSNLDIEGALIENCKLLDDRLEITLGTAEVLTIKCEDQNEVDQNADQDGAGQDNADQDEQDGLSFCLVTLRDDEQNITRSVGASVHIYDDNAASACFNEEGQHFDVVSQILEIQSIGDTADVYQFYMFFEAADSCEHEDLVDESLSCRWFDHDNSRWSRQGCKTLQSDVGPDGGSTILCECVHLTAFAIIQEIAKLKDRCDMTHILGNNLWLIFSILYILLMMCASFQLYDILVTEGCKVTHKVSVHALIVIITLLDVIIGFSMYQSDAKSSNALPIYLLAVIWTVLYSMSFATYSLMILMWVQICTTNMIKRSRERDCMDWIFGAVVAVASVLLMIMFIFAATANQAAANNAVVIGSILITIMCIGCAFAFSVYGFKLIHKIQDVSKLNVASSANRRYTPLVRRLYNVTLIISSSFVLQSVVHFLSAVDNSLFVENFEIFQSIYLFLDLLTLFTVLYLFREVVQANRQEMKRGVSSVVRQSTSVELTRNNEA